jgi:hypothetical protein
LPADEGDGQTACAITVSPEVVDAGAEMTLQCQVSCSPACDLRGHTLFVKDQAGADMVSIELAEFDGQTNETNELTVHAPVETGTYTWVAVCPPVVKAGVSYMEVSTPVSFTVKAHTTHVVAWDIPSAVEVGERFRIKVAIKCSNECRLANRGFGIYDHEGREVATGTLSGDLWPGTTGLYVAEVELEAPATAGLYTWSVKDPGSDVGKAQPVLESESSAIPSAW